MSAGNWMIYGANGYTGELIARAAAARGLRPVLAGRSEARLAPLADELGLSARAFALDDPAAARRLADIDLVLHCAGPFSTTAAPMVRACLAAGAHYLDITGEIAVFEHVHGQSEPAHEAGVVLCSGVGFDVVPTDCVAAALKAALPDAVELNLGFDSRSGVSPGTARTSVESLGQGGRARMGGRIRRVPLAWRVRSIDFGDGEKLATTIPWGDVATAYYSTGISDIAVYIPASRRLIVRLKRLNFARPLLRLRLVQRLMKARIGRRVRGPDAAERAKQPMFVWGEAINGAGERRTARVRTANGYDVTASAALAIVERVLADPPAGGSYTPSQLTGARFVETLPGSDVIVIE